MNGRLGLIIDGTGHKFNVIRKEKMELEAIGYDTYMVFVDTSLDVAQARNIERTRKLRPKIVEDSWKEVQKNKEKYSGLFGSNFILINNNDNIAGYQFSIEGGDVISASGGLSEDNDFIISIEKDMVLSFSSNEGGVFVRGGNQLLINLLIKPWDTYVCIHDIVIADVTGEEIPSLSRDCFQP